MQWCLSTALVALAAAAAALAASAAAAAGAAHAAAAHAGSDATLAAATNFAIHSRLRTSSGDASWGCALELKVRRSSIPSSAICVHCDASRRHGRSRMHLSATRAHTTTNAAPSIQTAVE